jgi:hypothetical protein
MLVALLLLVLPIPEVVVAGELAVQHRHQIMAQQAALALSS